LSRPSPHFSASIDVNQIFGSSAAGLNAPRDRHRPVLVLLVAGDADFERFHVFTPFSLSTASTWLRKVQSALPSAAVALTQLAQLGASFCTLSQVIVNQIKELEARNCLFRRVVTTKGVDLSR
jgi:hypothetical protein